MDIGCSSALKTGGQRPLILIAARLHPLQRRTAAARARAPAFAAMRFPVVAQAAGLAYFTAERLRNQLGRNLPVLHWVALLEAAVDARTPPDDAWNSDARTLAEWRHGEGWVYRTYPNRAAPPERDARSIRCYWLQPQIDQWGRIERVITRIVGMPPRATGLTARAAGLLSGSGCRHEGA